MLILLSRVNGSKYQCFCVGQWLYYGAYIVPHNRASHKGIQLMNQYFTNLCHCVVVTHKIHYVNYIGRNVHTYAYGIDRTLTNNLRKISKLKQRHISHSVAVNKEKY